MSKNEKAPSTETKNDIQETRRRRLLGVASLILARRAEKEYKSKISKHVDPLLSQIQRERSKDMDKIPRKEQGDKKAKPSMTHVATTEVMSTFEAMRGEEFDRAGDKKPALKDTKALRVKHKKYKLAERIGAVEPLQERLHREQSRVLAEISGHHLLGHDNGEVSEEVIGWLPYASPSHVLELKRSLISKAEVQGIKSDKTKALIDTVGIKNIFNYDVANYFEVTPMHWAAQSKGITEGIPQADVVPPEIIDQVNFLIKMPEEQLSRLAELEDKRDLHTRDLHT